MVIMEQLLFVEDRAAAGNGKTRKWRIFFLILGLLCYQTPHVILLRK